MLVNYVREINAFHRYANDNYLNSSERLLWFGLMDCINQSMASGANWPDDYVGITNKCLLSHVPFGEDALMDARNRLKQRGLLAYIPGRKNKEAPKYRMCYFSAQAQADDPQAVQGGHPKTEGSASRTAPDAARLHPLKDAEDYAQDELEQARECARETVYSAFPQHFGRRAAAAEAERLSTAFVNLSMESDVLHEAIRTAAENGARNPVHYVLQLLETWSYECIRTRADLDQYRLMYDMHHGRGAFGGQATVSFAQMQDARDKRRRGMDDGVCASHLPCGQQKQHGING